MLKKFRRRSSKAVPSVSESDKSANASAPIMTTFFSLPAELRNQIYEIAANGVTLTLATNDRKKAFSRTTPIPGLFLASRQCRLEYRPILLAVAHIQAPIINFDFTHLIRISASLYSIEQKALRANRNLVIKLIFSRIATPTSRKLLRRWALNRSNSLDRLPWRYDWDIPGRPMYSNHDNYNSSDLWIISHEQAVCSLKLDVEDSVGWELDAIIQATNDGLDHVWITTAEMIMDA